MPRILAILVVVSFFLPFLSFASEPPAEAPAVDTISVPVYLFADDSGGILAIAPLTDELFVWTYAPLATSGMRQETGNIVGEITYDGLDRLLGATVTTQTATSSSQIVSNYTYGATGNLLTSPAGVYSYDGFSGGVFVNPHAATGVGSRALGYDSNGNLTSDTLQPGSGQAGGSANIANGWNYRNELTSTTIAQTSVSYGYDPAGQRVSLREQTGASVVSTNFPTPAYSETTLPSGSIERMVSIEAAGLPVATIRTRNTDAPEIFITHTDHLRSTRLVTTEGAGLGSVNIVEQTDYDAFGKITRHEFD